MDHTLSFMEAESGVFKGDRPLLTFGTPQSTLLTPAWDLHTQEIVGPAYEQPMIYSPSPSGRGRGEGHAEPGTGTDGPHRPGVDLK